MNNNRYHNPDKIIDTQLNATGFGYVYPNNSLIYCEDTQNTLRYYDSGFVIFSSGSEVDKEIKSLSGLLTQGYRSNILGWTGSFTDSHTGISSRVYLETYNNTNVLGSSFRGRRFRGTPSNPSGVLKDDQLVQLAGGGYDTTGIAQEKGGLRVIASENWATGSHGTYILFATTPTGTTERLDRVKIANDGRVGIANLNPQYTLDVSGSGNFTQGLFVNGIPVNTGSNGGLSQVTADTLYYPLNNPSGFATGVDVSSLVSKTSFNSYTGNTIKLIANLISGTQGQNISFPVTFSSIPTVICEFENNMDNFIYNHAVYGVSTSGFNISFSDILTNSGYRIYSTISV